MKRGHIPHRMCIVCRSKVPKKNLIRMACTDSGKIVYDALAPNRGKGIYICRSETCLNSFLNGKKFKKRFHSQADPTVFAELKGKLEDPEDIQT